MDHTPQVDAEDPAPVVEGLVAQQVERRDARVVAQHVDAPEPRERRRGQVVDRGGIGHVDRHRLRLAAGGADAGGDHLGLGAVEVGDDDCGSGGGERLGERAPDATGRAGHHRHPTRTDHVAG